MTERRLISTRQVGDMTVNVYEVSGVLGDVDALRRTSAELLALIEESHAAFPVSPQIRAALGLARSLHNRLMRTE